MPYLSAMASERLASLASLPAGVRRGGGAPSLRQC